VRIIYIYYAGREGGFAEENRRHDRIQEGRFCISNKTRMSYLVGF
jgi:hypothetical protein